MSGPATGTMGGPSPYKSKMGVPAQPAASGKPALARSSSAPSRRGASAESLADSLPSQAHPGKQQAGPALRSLSNMSGRRSSSPSPPPRHGDVGKVREGFASYAAGETNCIERMKEDIREMHRAVQLVAGQEPPTASRISSRPQTAIANATAKGTPELEGLNRRLERYTYVRDPLQLATMRLNLGEMLETKMGELFGKLLEESEHLLPGTASADTDPRAARLALAVRTQKAQGSRQLVKGLMMAQRVLAMVAALEGRGGTQNGIRSELASARAKCKTLETEMAQMRGTSAAPGSYLSLKEEVKRLQKTAEHDKHAMKVAKVELDRLVTCNQELSAAKRRLEAAAGPATADPGTKKALVEAQTRGTSLAHQLAEAQGTAESLSERLLASQSGEEGLRMRLASSSKSEAQARAEAARFGRETEEHKARADATAAQLVAARGECENIKQQLREVTGQLGEACGASSAVADLQQQLTQAEASAEELKGRLAKAQDGEAELRRQAAHLTAQLEIVRKEASERKEQARLAISHLAECQANQQRCEQLLRGRASDVEHAAASESAARGRANELEVQTERLQKQLAEQRREGARLEAEVAKLQADVAQAGQAGAREAVRLRCDVDAERAAGKELEAANRAFVAKVNALQEQCLTLEDAKREAVGLRDKVSEIARGKADALSRAASAEAEAENLRVKLYEAERAYQSTVRHAQAQEADLQAERAELSKMTKELEMKRAEMEDDLLTVKAAGVLSKSGTMRFEINGLSGSPAHGSRPGTATEPDEKYRLSKQVRELQDRVRMFQTQAAERQAMLEQAQAVARTAGSGSVSRLQEENTQLKAQLQELRRAADEAPDGDGALTDRSFQAEAEGAGRHAQDLHEELLAARTQLESAELSLRAKDAEVQQQVDSLRREKAEAQRRADSNSRQLFELQLKMRDLQQHHLELGREAAAPATEADQAPSGRGAGTELQALKEALAAEEQKAGRALAHVSKQDKMIAALKSRLRDLDESQVTPSPGMTWPTAQDSRSRGPPDEEERMPLPSGSGVEERSSTAAAVWRTVDRRTSGTGVEAARSIRRTLSSSSSAAQPGQRALRPTSTRETSGAWSPQLRRIGSAWGTASSPSEVIRGPSSSRVAGGRPTLTRPGTSSSWRPRYSVADNL